MLMMHFQKTVLNGMILIMTDMVTTQLELTQMHVLLFQEPQQKTDLDALIATEMVGQMIMMISPMMNINGLMPMEMDSLTT